MDIRELDRPNRWDRLKMLACMGEINEPVVVPRRDFVFLLQLLEVSNGALVKVANVAENAQARAIAANAYSKFTEVMIYDVEAGAEDKG